MGLLKQFAESVYWLFGPTAEDPVAGTNVPDPQTVTDQNALALGNFTFDPEKLYVSPTRSGRYADFDAMDSGDIASSLDAVCDTATWWDRALEDSNRTEMGRMQGFRVVMGRTYGTAGAKKVIDNALLATGLKSLIWDVARKVLKYGDCWVELVFDPEDLYLLDLAVPSPSTMITRLSPHGKKVMGRDKDGHANCYRQVNAGGKVVASWLPWQMVQFQLHPVRGRPYSERSLLDYMRRDWLLLTMGEEATAEMRRYRATPRRHIYVDVTGRSQDEAEKVVQERTQFFRRVSGPGAGKKDRSRAPGVQSDIVVPRKYFTQEGIDRALESLDKVELEDPNVRGIADINDLEYFRKKQMAKIPGEMVGIMSETRRDLTLQDIQFGRFVQRVQEQLTVGIRQILDTALVLQGFDPAKVEYTVEWPKVTVGTDWKFGDALFRMSMGHANMLASNVVRPSTVGMKMYGFSREEAEEEAEAAYKWRLDHPEPVGQDTDNDGKVDPPEPKQGGQNANPTPFHATSGPSKKDLDTRLAQMRSGAASG